MTQQVRSLTRRTYRMSEHGSEERQNRAGDFVLQPGARAETWRPSWDHPTTIRIYPGLDPDDPTRWDPYRLRSDHPSERDRGGFGDWLRRYPAMRQAGVGSGATFLLSDMLDPLYNMNNNPAWVLYRAIADAEKANTIKPAWRPLLKGAAGRGAALPRPSTVVVVQGAIMECGGKVYADPGKGSPPRGGAPEDLPVVVVLSRSAGEVLENLCDERIEGSRASCDDFENYYANGDIVSLEHGRFITFFQEGKDPRASRPQPGPAQTTFGASATPHRDQRTRSRNADFSSYDAFADKVWNGIPAQLPGPQLESLVRARVLPWDSILRFMSDKEQALVLARAFSAVPDMVVYAFRDHPDWVPEDVLAALTGRVAASVPQGPRHGEDVFGMPASGAVSADGGPSLWGRAREGAAGLFAPPGTTATPGGAAATPDAAPVAPAETQPVDPAFEERKRLAMEQMKAAKEKAASAH